MQFSIVIGQFAYCLLPTLLCRAAIINRALVDREGMFILLSASHSTRVSTPTTAISGPIWYVDENHALH